MNLGDFGVKMSDFGAENGPLGVYSYPLTALPFIGFFMGFLGLRIWDFGDFSSL